MVGSVTYAFKRKLKFRNIGRVALFYFSEDGICHKIEMDGGTFVKKDVTEKLSQNNIVTESVTDCDF